MARYQAVLAYDGTLFHGFQRQAADRSVQSEFENALRRIGWQGVSILAAGRTDTGVHASGQVVAFDLEWAHETAKLTQALNANLPADVAVKAVQAARADFHPRFDALSRRYRYRILLEETRNPLRERFTWRLWPAPDWDLLSRAASQFPGEHDFKAFGTPPLPGGPTMRRVLQAVWERQTDELVFEIEANAFLYHMVRRIVQLQVEVALGRLPLECVGQYLNQELPGPVQGLAPPHALSLVAVQY